MKTTKTIGSAILAILVLALCSFSGDTKPLKNGDKWIPSDFDARNSTLLVETFVWHNRYKGDEGAERTEEMKEEMKAHYPYKYEFATKDQIENGDKYADKDKYRYALMWTHGSWTKPGGGTMTSAADHGTDFDYYIYDRKTDIRGATTRKSNSYLMPIFKATLATIVEYMKGLTK